MNLPDLLLVIISGAGLLHGLLLAFYLGASKKRKNLSNVLLSLILLLMAYRIGKSVMLNFADHLELRFILLGLAVMLCIGPLLRWYTRSMTIPQYQLKRKQWIEMIPFSTVLVISLVISPDWLDKDMGGLVFFALLLLLAYTHFAFYIFLSWRHVKLARKHFATREATKSQEAILNWLQVLVIGFAVIWLSYVLNVLEENIPYISGPVLYSMGIYYLSYRAFQLKVTEMDGAVFKIEEQSALMFKNLAGKVETEKLYLEPDLSLLKLGKLAGMSNQKTSALINQYAKKNVNDFINHFRIDEAKLLLADEANRHHTISSIAYDSGFSSLSSFNSAFKKFEGMTPSQFRKIQG